MVLTAWLVLIIALLIIITVITYLSGYDLIEGLVIVLISILLVGSSIAIAWALTVLP